MQELNHVPRSDCNEPLPTLRWNDDGGVDLLDLRSVLQPQESHRPPLGGGGC